MEYVDEMWKVRVVNGRLVIDETTDLPDGTEFKVQRVATLTPEEEEEIRRSVERGGSIPAAELLARLRR